MDFTAKIKDYISNENEVSPFREKLDALQLDMDNYLERNKGYFEEYSLEAFEEVLKRRKAMISLQEIVESMERRSRDLKIEIIQDLSLLKGGKLKLAIDDSSYLISSDGDQIYLGRAFE